MCGNLLSCGTFGIRLNADIGIRGRFEVFGKIALRVGVSATRLRRVWHGHPTPNKNCTTFTPHSRQTYTRFPTPVEVVTRLQVNQTH